MKNLFLWLWRLVILMKMMLEVMIWVLVFLQTSLKSHNNHKVCTLHTRSGIRTNSINLSQKIYRNMAKYTHYTYIARNIAKYTQQWVWKCEANQITDHRKTNGGLGCQQDLHSEEQLICICIFLKSVFVYFQNCWGDRRLRVFRLGDSHSPAGGQGHKDCLGKIASFDISSDFICMEPKVWCHTNCFRFS